MTPIKFGEQIESFCKDWETHESKKDLVHRYRWLQQVFMNTDIKLYMKNQNLWQDSMNILEEML